MQGVSNTWLQAILGDRLCIAAYMSGSSGHATCVSCLNTSVHRGDLHIKSDRQPIHQQRVHVYAAVVKAVQGVELCKIGCVAYQIAEELGWGRCWQWS